MPRHRECGSHPATGEEISSSKFGWGGSRANSGGQRSNSGGPRPNSGGHRAGAGRKAKSAVTGSRKPASKALVEARLARSIESLALPAADGDRWYCAQTRYRAELIAVEELTKQGFPTLLLRTETELPDRRLVIVPAFPGYLFIRFDRNDDRWRPITSTPGIRSLFGSSPDLPTAAPPGIIERFIQQAGPEGIVRKRLVPPPDPFKRDDVFRVIDGPFTDLVAICKMSAGRRIKTMVQIFGRETPAEFDIAQLERVA